MSERISTETSVILAVLVNQGGKPVFQVGAARTVWAVKDHNHKEVKCEAVIPEGNSWIKQPQHTTILDPNTAVNVIGDMGGT